MKANKRFAEELGMGVNPDSRRDWIPWLLDHLALLMVFSWVLTVGALAQYLVPLAVWVFAGISVAGVAILIVSYVIVFANADDDPGDEYSDS